MKRFQSILCASLLTIALSSTALAGNISGIASPGDISGKPGQISGKPGQISGRPGQISGKPGQISGITWSVIESIITLVSVIG